MSGKDEEVSLQDEIRAAFKTATEAADDLEKEEKAPVEEEVKKDEDEGKAAASEDKPAAVADDKKPAADDEGKAEKEDAGATEESGAVKLTDAKAPSSWSPKVREKWGELPEDVRNEIIRREEASINGVRKLQEEYAPIKKFVDGLTPYMREVAQQGLQPDQFVVNVLSAERGLRNPSPEARFQALLGIADQYGIPLRQIVNQSLGREVVPAAPAQQQPAQLPPEVLRELEESRRFREETSVNVLQEQINQFSTDPRNEFFNDVRDIMADLIESGRAKDMREAYDQAVWLEPNVRSVMIDRQKAEAAQSSIRQKQAGAASAAIKAAGNADVQVDDDNDDSTEAIIRRAMRESAGRI